MNCLFICDPFTKRRQELKDVDLNITVDEFKKTVSMVTDIQEADQELLYFGRPLDVGSKPLESYNIKNKVTIFVLKKPKPHTKDEVQAILNKARNQSYRRTIRTLAKDRDAIGKLIEEHDTIKDDPITTALLQDSALLIAVLNTAKADRIVSDFRCLGLALKVLVNKVVAMAAVHNFQYNDNEEDNVLASPYLSRGEMETDESQPTQSTGSQISASDLANALSFASMSQTSGSSFTSSASSTNEQLSSSLAQMRAIGITDEALGMRALLMAEGNVEAAINIIFEGGLQ